MRKKEGFTLIELLIVIGIIAVLMAIAIVAINPGKQFAKANNAKRWGDVAAVADAISIRTIEYKGSWPTGAGCEALPTSGPYPLAYDDPADGNDPAIVDICDCIVDEYLGSMPKDPTVTAAINCGAAYDTGYEITGTAAGRIKISAPDCDSTVGTGACPISVSR